ncbi:conserved Plasmodium protein, unknown function [Plasmodium relictum]|uniref:Uncharacterized protein n=1 Tax=Plasmodium relictum TaxID=85471 RepID=A0A1J1HDV9_PLARL|nr:conserved Plasmodium protein, unknown function [Plasmodium relictum]CRH03725.1 conserved Plasmodium protein, unknown function [Plasmodium relictum]
MKEKKNLEKICYSIINYFSFQKNIYYTNYYNLKNRFFFKKNYKLFFNTEKSYKHNITKIEDEKKDIKRKEEVISDVQNIKKFELIIDNCTENENENQNQNIYEEKKKKTINKEQNSKKELCKTKKKLEESNTSNIKEEINFQTHQKIRASENFNEKTKEGLEEEVRNNNSEKKVNKCKSYNEKEKFNIIKKEENKKNEKKNKGKTKCNKKIDEIKKKDTKIVKKEKIKNKVLASSSKNENNNKTCENGNSRKSKKKIHVNEIPITTNFNKENYFKEFQQIGLKNNIVMYHLEKIEDISTFVNNTTSLNYENIYAYNNFLYEIYDKFSNSEIKKVKKLIKNYNKLTKKNLKKKIKYFQIFYELCPKEYNQVLTCLFIQSVDILKSEDISNTFYYDHILNNSKEGENNSILEEFENLETNNDDVGKREMDTHTNYIKNPYNISNKSVYEIDVNFENNETKSINENNFVIVYNLPIISYDLLIEELKETFSFCGNIKNVEFFSERLKTVDLNLLNNELISENNKKRNDNNNINNHSNNKNLKNSLNPNSYTHLYAVIEFENEKSANLATGDFIRIFGIFCYNKLIYVDKCVNKKIMVITHLPFHLNIYNILYLLLNASLYDIDVFNINDEFHNKKHIQNEKLNLDSKKIGNNLNKSGEEYKEHLNKESDKENLIIFKENTYDTNKENLNESFEEKINESSTKNFNEDYTIKKGTFTLRNSNVKIENTNSFFTSNYINNSDIYNYIYEISKKNFKKFEEENKRELETKINDNSSNENNYESFVDFYQSEKNKKLKTKKVNINNNGRTLILHFDNFKNLFECLKKFKYIFKNKSYMIFSLNLRRCMYLNGMIKDHIFIKNSENKIDLKIKD